MKTEKVSVNLSPVELGQIDYLVERGLFDSRSDFIRSATRESLKKDYAHEFQNFLATESDEPKSSWYVTIGVNSISKSEIYKIIAGGKKMKIHVIGLLNISKDITANEIVQAIESCKVYGKLAASPEVKAALKLIEQGRN